MTHICVGKLSIIGSDNGLSPGRCQAIIWTNAGILLIRPLGTNFSEILIGIQTFSLKKIHLKMSFAKLPPFCLGLNMLTNPTIMQFASQLLYWPACLNPLKRWFRVGVVPSFYFVIAPWNSWHNNHTCSQNINAKPLGLWFNITLSSY